MNPWDRPPTRTISDLTEDERKVIKERANGWESASPGLLALVFSVPVQAIKEILRKNHDGLD